jgi:hypothetical protein
MRTAIFWDIDGTLVNTGGIGAPILESAVEEITHRKSLIDKKLMSGFTDYEIVRQLSENSSTVISKKDIEKVILVPISKTLNYATAFVILLIFQLCFAAFLLYLLNYQFDQFILTEDWVKIPFSRTNVNKSILLEIVIFSVLNALNILTMVRFFPRIKTIIQILAIIYLTFNNYVLPGSAMYENAKNLCKDK